MGKKPYIANYESALSFMTRDQHDAAFEVLQRALSQVPENEMTGDNAAYLNILSQLSFLFLERRELERAYDHVSKGLEAKKDHADLLFLKSLVMFDLNRYDEMLEAIINYLVAIDEGNAHLFDYRFVNPGIFKELFERLIPKAYQCSFQHEQIRDIVYKLYSATGNERFKKTYEIMVNIDNTTSREEH